MMFDKRRAALHPVAIIHVDNAIDLAHFGDVNVAANGAVKAFAVAKRKALDCVRIQCIGYRLRTFCVALTQFFVVHVASSAAVDDTQCLNTSMCFSMVMFDFFFQFS